MPKTYARLKSLIQTAADATGDALTRILLGATGSWIDYPEDPDLVAVPRESGELWEPNLLVPGVLEDGVGAEFDRAAICWAVLDMDMAGAVPKITVGSGFDPVTLTKDSALNTFAVQFLATYKYSHDSYVVYIKVPTQPYPCSVYYQDKDRFDVQLLGVDGLALPGNTIDFKSIFVATIGTCL